jgi:hypothetical protein
LTSIQFFNPVFNIRASLGNNTFSVAYNPSTSTATIPDGLYDIVGLNGWLQNIFLTSLNLYVLDANGSPYFFQSFSPTQHYCGTYGSLPLTLPVGGSNPKNLTLNNATPLFTVNTPGFSTLLGYNQGTWPSSRQAAQYQLNSQNIPQMNGQFQYNVCCSWVSQVQFQPIIPSAIFPFSPAGIPIGGQASIMPANHMYYPILPDQNGYTSITISLVDQVGNAIAIDPQWSVVVSIRKQQR